MTSSGWGKFPTTKAHISAPTSAAALERLLGHSPNALHTSIARGAGRSYGDSALADHLISTRYLDNFLGLTSSERGEMVLHCAAGLSLDQVLNTIVPKGLFLPVLPGAKAVTLGGAIASDVHGKNHHLDGSFCDHVDSFRLLLASGEILNCSRTHNAELFKASCAGMGLTGIVLDAKLRLRPLLSASLRQTALVAKNLAHCMELMDAHAQSPFSVAWVDCLATGESLGRSVLYLGDFKPQEEAHRSAQKKRSQQRNRPPELKPRAEINIPLHAPSFLLNRYTMGSFNSGYYRLKKLLPTESTVDYDSFFFPLERLKNWNRLYGRRGFLQYQFVVPCETAFDAISSVLNTAAKAGKGSFLSVLKRFGKGNDNYLSFPFDGYTLALDFKLETSLFPLLEKLDAIILQHGGRLYLAKDARMSAELFRKTYPNWERFMEIKAKYDPEGFFSSLQSRRLGLS
jgi:FAD/FMN-containing dehydrogenase